MTSSALPQSSVASPYWFLFIASIISLATAVTSARPLSSRRDWKTNTKGTTLIIISHSFLGHSLHAFEVLFCLRANFKNQYPFILYGSTSNQVRTKSLRRYLQCCKGRAPRTAQSLKKQNRFQTHELLTYNFLYFFFIVARMIVTKIYGDELISKKVLSALFSPKAMYHRANSLQILRTNKSTAMSLTP